LDSQILKRAHVIPTGKVRVCVEEDLDCDYVPRIGTALAPVKGGAQALDEFGSIHAVAMATREELMSRLGAAEGVAIYILQ
jgi:hypothetical protein